MNKVRMMSSSEVDDDVLEFFCGSANSTDTRPTFLKLKFKWVGAQPSGESG
jgi:hypothetical protein